MNTFYSASERGFYLTAVNGDDIPLDAVALTNAQYQELLDGPPQGLLIEPNEEGYPTLVSPAPPSLDEWLQQYQIAVQRHMDQVARGYGYDDLKTAVSYADEPAVPRFQAEGQAFRSWRSLCLNYCLEQQEAIKSGEREPVVTERLLSELPEFTLSVTV